jgi:hypothetical protein
MYTPVWLWEVEKWSEKIIMLLGFTVSSVVGVGLSWSALLSDFSLFVLFFFGERTNERTEVQVEAE